nr:RNA-directed DNA polymerase, eukaryota [Tanacetum cinerariifolium]
MNGFDKMVEDSWKNLDISDPNSMISLKKKLQALKISIKQWLKEAKSHSSRVKASIHKRLIDLDKSFDQGTCNDELLLERTNLLKELHDINSCTDADMRQKAKKTVGNGESTSFWDDQWVNESTLKSRLPRGGLEEEQLQQLEESLGHVLLPQTNDRWTWNLESSGEFSVKSTRNFLDNALLPKLNTPTRWIHVVPIKISIFAWRVSMDKLPSRLNLSLRGIDIPSILCPICCSAVESFSHLFSFHLACQLMSKFVRWWEIEPQALNSYDEWIIWFQNIRLSKKFNEILEGACYVMWWIVWKFRNQVLFGTNQPRMEFLFDEIVRLSFHWCSNRCNLNLNWNSWMMCPSSMSL